MHIIFSYHNSPQTLNLEALTKNAGAVHFYLLIPKSQPHVQNNSTTPQQEYF